MAADDYYEDSSYARPAQYTYPQSIDRSAASKPYYDYTNDSQPQLRVTSPFDDRAYPYSRPTPPHRNESEDVDPFRDGNAIPMSGRAKMADSTTSVAPMLPHQMEDPFVRDADEQRSREKTQEQGWFKGKITWVVYVLTIVQVIVFIVEIVKNGTCLEQRLSRHEGLTLLTAILTKSPIEIHPSFNPMIGPSPYVLINMGSRYQPCMHTMPNVQNSTGTISWPCPNATATTGDSVTCSLSDLCGFGGVPNPHIGGNLLESPAPDQWWRFIVPIFLHAGIIHIGFNLLLQMTMGRDVELLIGSIRFALVYFASGIFGFVLGGNFAASGIASCGCSGSIFGILAITLLDLLYTWKDRTGPIKDLLFIGVDIVIAFVLGLLPGLDNFSHIGGFLMGLVLGICILRSPSAFTRRPTNDDARPVRYSGVSAPIVHAGPSNDGVMSFVKSPLTFFQHRRAMWWGWWVIRFLMLVGCLVGFILLLKNFYVWRTTCGWCKYLSCLDVTVGNTKWCDVGNLDFTPNPSAGTS